MSRMKQLPRTSHEIPCIDDEEAKKLRDRLAVLARVIDDEE